MIELFNQNANNIHSTLTCSVLVSTGWSMIDQTLLAVSYSSSGINPKACDGRGSMSCHLSCLGVGIAMIAINHPNL